MAQKRVSRQVKKETSTSRNSQFLLDEQAQEDALDRAEQLLNSKKLHQTRSPGKQRKAKQHSDDDDESGEDDDYGSEMEDFIANDEEVEAEFMEAAQKKDHERKKKRRHQEHVKQLDDEDVDLIRENVGIEVKKKSRLKRTAMLEQSNDAQSAQYKQEDVDMPMESRSTKPVSGSQKLKSETQKVEQQPDNPVKFKKQRLELEQAEFQQPHQNKAINPDRLQQAQKIFGESNEQPPNVVMRSQQKTSLKEFFNADEIDDPFNTEADLRIAEADCPERLQVKLDNRMKPNQDTQELQVEAEWVLERLTCIHDADNKYGKLVHAAGTREKVFKVLKMFHCEFLDIPMICKYRKFEYAPELDEDAIWHIFNLDQEFGKFQRNKAQVNEFLLKVLKFDQRIKSYIDELCYAKSQSELNNFNALIRYLRYQFTDQLTHHPSNDEEGQTKRKQPQSRDEIQIARSNRIHEFSKLCFLECGQFQENLQYKKLKHSPPEPKASPQTVAAEFCSKAFSEESELLQAVCRYAAVELAAQPQIRNMMKKQLRDHGQITATPTDQGKKDLDVFHQSYRVKLVEELPLKQLQNSDLYLDIQQCEKANLVNAVIELPQQKHQDFKSFLEEFYMDNTQRKESWNLFRTLVVKILVDEILHKELIKEVRDEIQQEAEQYVISSCKKVYTELLMTGPFQNVQNQDMSLLDQPEQQQPSKMTKRQEDIIKSKERLVVMGALMHQIDANNYIVTIAVVDKYGEIIAHKDFMRLLPPRIKKQRPQPGAPQPDPYQGSEQPKTEEQLEHERDRATLIDILEKYSVDFIVVAANSLEARNLKQILVDLGCELKNKKSATADEMSKRGSQPRAEPKEAFVIWGSTEVAKLFSLSHNSQKLHKGVQQILKQTISLARFEQDPLNEVLNLWSPITAENQALALQLDPFQKLVNQSKLADGLEEVNIRVVNKVGVDLNVVIDHEHMHCCLQFLSGLGPRMAKRLLAKFKGLDKKLLTRGELLKQNLIPFKVYFSIVPFVLIKIPEEDFGKNQVQKYDILDQTRIHHEHYKLAMKIATDACNRSDGYDDEGAQKDVDKTEQNRRCKEVIARPQNLKNLDLKAYYAQLDLTNQGNMRIAIDHIIEEFRAPFADPRQARNPHNLAITNEKLFYLLIDESKKTFKKGLIVTATVSNVLEAKVICRLENGLTATIVKEKILDQDSHEKLRDVLDIGFIITGRIEKIQAEAEDKQFEVQLNCKKGDLHSHEKYLKDLADSLGIDARHIKEEDKKNLNFAEDQKPKMQGRFTPRRIAHEKFKNISSRRALAELQEAEVGEFVFRPSTRSEDAITLTWKFSRKQFVHIDITELEKMPGAAIGQRLMISNEHFDNLREIVERYIIPCNRLVREVTLSPKWSDAEKWEDLEEQLKDEKNSDKGRIPYRFAILPQYQQHLVLAYVPREKVIKEFIKVRPRGFYFHEQNLAPFINLVNWFKDQWQTKDYQRYLKRQRSPRTSVKTMPVVKETPGDDQGAGQGGHQWQVQGGGNSVHSNHGYSNVKSEQSQQRSFGRGQRSSQRRGDSPAGGQGGWNDQRMKYEQGGRSPAAWQQDNRYDNQDVFMAESYGQPDRNIPIQRGGGGGGQDRPRSNVCYRCDQEGHFAKDCQNPDKRGDRGGAPRKGCFNCGQDGHISRECQEPQKERRDRGPQECYKCHQMGHMSYDCPNQGGTHEQDRGGFKRQRIDGGSLRRNADGGFELGWNDDNQNSQAYTPKQNHW